jgi:hypothetical protein
VLVVLITLAGGLLYQSAPGIVFYTGIKIWDFGIGDFGVYALVLFGLLFIVNGLLLVFSRITVGARSITEHLRYAVSTDLWSPPGVGAVQSKDFAKRWFVTVAAATGSVVVSMLDSNAIFSAEGSL